MHQLLNQIGGRTTSAAGDALLLLLVLLVLRALLVLVGAKVTFPLLAANATAARATGKGPRGTGKGGWAPRGH